MAEDCLFCKIIAGELPSEKVYEDDEVVAILDLYPVRRGHTLVMPKQHTKDFASTDPDLLSRMIPKVQKIAEQVVQGTGAEGFNLAAFNGAVSGQEIFHLHFHIIPRNANDGVRMGWPKMQYKEGQMAEVAEKIRKAGK